jgi:ribosome-associated translation inhibitor RaiA
MRVEIRSRGMSVDGDMRAHLKQALRRAFGAVQRSISSVRVYVAALKGPGDGLGCRVVVKLKRSSRAVIVTERCPAFYALADRVVRRAGNAVRRRLQRKHTRRRRGAALAAAGFPGT